MAAQPVEWVLIVFYGPEAHRATYGRQVKSGRYTKDFIQLSRREEFIRAVTALFPTEANQKGSAPLTYRWPTGNAQGALVFNSADRPHLKWETSLGAPHAWKMALAPSDATSETIPGDPTHLDFESAENELSRLKSRGAGQPYLMAIKLQDEPTALHLRAYLKNPSELYAWGDLKLVPQDVQDLAAKTSQQSALAWSFFTSGGMPPDEKLEDALSQLNSSTNPGAVIETLDAGTGHALASYLRNPGHGLFFDPYRNHDGWSQPAPLPEQIAVNVDAFLKLLESRFPATSLGDAAAEDLDVNSDELDAFRAQIEHKSYEVPDATSTTKTRGSAQRAFAEAVKTNYGYRCAVTGIATKDFLVAAHIVPWSKDQSIRLDPSNGICLSLLVDRAFENGHLLIEDDLSISINWNRIGSDSALLNHLAPFDGQKLTAPARSAPRAEYLQRRRALVPI